MTPEMNLGENDSGADRGKEIATLAAEFNRTAESWTRGESDSRILFGKYVALTRHVAKEPEEKRVFVDILYTCTLRQLERLAEVNGPNAEKLDNAKITLLLAQLTDKNIVLLPEGAAEKLAEVSLNLLRRAEKSGQFDDMGRIYAMTLAQQTLEVADKVAAAALAAPEAQANKSAARADKPARKNDEKLSL